jgi:hypothetical protein
MNTWKLVNFEEHGADKIETTNCEECGKDFIGRSDMCDECYEYNYCECGTRLEEENGCMPGDGFCRKCG